MRKLRILIIDNDEDEQFFVQKGFLATELFEIGGIYNNGNDLIKSLQTMQELPDVILSDLNMPGKSGFDILKELKNDLSFANIPVVITTNVTTPRIEEECYKLGALNIYTKPARFLNYEQFAKDIYEDVAAID